MKVLQLLVAMWKHRHRWYGRGHSGGGGGGGGAFGHNSLPLLFTPAAPAITLDGDRVVLKGRGAGTKKPISQSNKTHLEVELFLSTRKPYVVLLLFLGSGRTCSLGQR